MSTINAPASDLVTACPRPQGTGGGSSDLVPSQLDQTTVPVPAPLTPPASGGMVAVLKALRRYWLLACCLGPLCSAAAAPATWFVMPASKYTVYSLLRVSALPPSVVFPTSETMADFQIYQKTQMALVKSRPVLNAALRDSDVARLVNDKRPSAVEWLEHEIKADFSLSPEILQVSLKGDQPEDLKVLVNAVVIAYMEEVVNSDKKRRHEALRHVEQVAKEYADSLSQKHQDLRNLIDAVGATEQSAGVKQQFAQEKLNQSEKELLALLSELRRAEIELELFQEKQKKGADLLVSDVTLDEFVRNHAELKKYEDRRVRLEDELETLAREARLAKDHPTVRLKHAELASLQTTLEKKGKELRPKLREELRGKMRAQLEAKGEQLRDRIRVMKKTREELEKEVKQQKEAVRLITSGSHDIVTTQQTITHTEEIAKRVANQVEALKVELRAPERVTRYEEATATQSDDLKKRLAASGLAGAGSLGLVLFGIVWRELRFRRVNSVEEVTHGLGLNLMGTVPALPRRLGRVTMTADDLPDETWQYQLTESVDAARALLLHAARRESLKAVMITSAVSGEGKTSLATQLAVSLGRTGRKILLIDSDLRNPGAHRVFDLPRGPGLSELLRGEASVAEAVRATPAAQLSMICAGRCSPEAIQALAQNGMQPILDDLKQQYDFIVVDSCPVLPVADALLIGQHVDAVVFSVLQEVSRLPRVAAAYQRLQMLGIRMLGAVVLGTREEVYGQVYRYLGPAENEDSDGS